MRITLNISLLIIGFLVSTISFGQITVDFSAPITEGCNSLQASFTDMSSSTTGNIVSWQWNLGGTTSSQQNPSIIYNQLGAYTICLTATDDQGNSDSICKDDYINIYPDPVADFTIDPTSGCSPVLSSFTNTSQSPNGVLQELVWDVGGSANLIIIDNPDSIIQSTYVEPSSYAAILLITDEKGCSDSKTINNALVVNPNPILDYNIDILSGCELPWTIQFSSNNPDPQLDIQWDYGNGETSTGPGLNQITYDTVGTYDITIILDRLGCKDTLRESLLVDPDSGADFAYMPIGACANTPITFQDASIGAPDSIFWDFGDGTTVTNLSPSHVYTNMDCYDVMMIRYSGTCIDTVRKECIQINPKPVVITEVINQYACSLPTTVEMIASADQEGIYAWNFSGLTNPFTSDNDTASVLINEFGEYAIDLTFTSLDGCPVVIETIPVIIEQFETNLPNLTIEGCGPLQVSLTDSTSSNLSTINWEWMISGPSLQSYTSSNPNFTLQDTGRYDVRLIVESETGCLDTIIREDYIRVGMPPEVDFTATPVEDCVLTPKDFTALTSDYTTAWVWGANTADSISLEENPSIILTTAIPWDITLTAYHYGCPNSLTKPEYLNILEPAVNYIVEYDCDDPYTVTLDDRTTGADSSFWEIQLAPDDRDTFFNTLLQSYTFPARGKYFINHYAISYETGCEHYRSDTVFITDPVAIMTGDTTKGCAPLSIDISGSSIDGQYYDYIIPGASLLDTALSADDAMITYPDSGIFSPAKLVITDIHGCQDSISLTDSIQVNKPTATADFLNGTCIPGSIELTDLSTDALGVIVDRTWRVDPSGDISKEENFFTPVDVAQSYNISLAVTDNWGCYDSIYILDAVLGSDISPEFYTSDTISCTGHGITFNNIINDPEIISYLWDFGDGETSTTQTPIHSYEIEGTYTVCLTVSNDRLCERMLCKEQFISIQNPVALFTGDPLYEVCPPLLSNFSNNSIHANTYEWSFGDNSGNSTNSDPAHLYNMPGSYDVSLIASSSIHCSDTLIKPDYVVVDGPTGFFDITTDNNCVPLTVTLTAEANDNYNFTWDFGNGIISSSSDIKMTDTVEFSYNTPGNYLPKLILSDGNGCEQVFETTFIPVNSLELDFTTDKTVTCDPSTDFTLSNLSTSTDPTINYIWEITGNENKRIESDNASFALSTPGSYDVSLFSNGVNCIDTLTIENHINVGSVPSVDFTYDADLNCELTPIALTNTTTNIHGNIVEYNWSFGDGTEITDSLPNHSYTATGSFEIILEAVTEFGCTDDQTQTINILANTVPSLPEDYTMCIGDSVEIEITTIGSGLANTTYSWSNDESLSCDNCPYPYASPTDSTEYIIYANHSNGCISTDTMNVHVVPIAGPELSLSLDTVICNLDTARISITNFDDDLVYNWDPHPTLDCLDCEEVSAFPQNHTYYSVTVRNEFGCFKKDSLFVAVERTTDDFLIQSKGVCEGVSSIISADPTINNPIWSGPGLSCTNCYDTEITPIESNYYYLTAQSDIGCTYTDSVFIISVPENAVTISDDDLICRGEELPISAQGYGQVTWSPSAGIDNISSQTPIASPETTTLYTATYVLDECTKSDSLTLEVITKADISAIGDTICLDEIASLSVSGLVDTYSWMKDGDLIESADTLSYDTDINTDIMVIGQLGLCEDDTAFASIMVNPDIDVTIDAYSYTLFINSAEKIDITYDEAANYSYQWTPSEGLDCDDCPDPKISDIQTATEYTLLVTDEDTGCTIEETITASFYNRCSEKAFYIPNIFSPNGDGRNDYFYITAEDPMEFDALRLFDRWGNRLHVSLDINNQWDGTFKGAPVPAGVYPYSIDYTCLDTGESFVFYGDITVIR